MAAVQLAEIAYRLANLVICAKIILEGVSFLANGWNMHNTISRANEMKTITIKCKCGATLDLPDPGTATCPKCGQVYRATQSGISWSTPAPK